MSLQDTLHSQLRDLRVKYQDAISRDDSLALAIEAAEVHLKCLKLATSTVEKKTLKETTMSLFDEAEKLKKNPNYAPARPIQELVFGPKHDEHASENSNSTQPRIIPPAVRLLSPPQSTRQLSITEQRLVLEGSRLNAAIFPPWKATDDAERFDLQPNGQLFTDEYPYHLSREQTAMLDAWKRPSDALPPPFWSAETASTFASPDHFMKAEQGIDLVQDAATDCSVVASLTAAHARTDRGFEKLLSGAIHPYNTTEGRPEYSALGRYSVRLNFNGCFRKVVIDDRLPVSKTPHILHVVDRNNPTLLWPALLEKAYMKICGGYDFLGSNSGTDLWTMIGWIPEQVLLQHDATEPDKLWQRIVKAFSFGDVLITLGTGKISPRVERELGLVGEHDYAVLALEQIDEQRRFLIKNPWLRGVDRKSIEPVRSAPFWLDLQHVVQNFENIYLSWDPGLFTHRQDIHFAWDLQDGHGRSAAGSFTRNPQYTLSCASSGPVWILLSKHFVSREKTSTTSRRAEFISLYLFASDGRRVDFSRRALDQSPYVDSPQALLKVDARANTKYTVVVSEQELKDAKHSFTLSIFAASRITLEAAQPRFAHSTTYVSAWTRDTAGGRADLPTFSQNPQFKLELQGRSSISLVLETATAELRVHVTLLHGQDQRVYTISTRDVVADSGMYRSGCAIAETRETIPAGKYTVVCSTYDSNTLGKFTLRLEANVQATLKPIPREGGGRLRTRLEDAIFRGEVATLAAPITLQRICHASFTAQYISLMPVDRSRPMTQSPLRLTVELGRGPDRRILLESTIGFDGNSGNILRTNEIDLRPDMRRSAPLYLVLERNEGYEGVANCDEVVKVEMWLDLLDGLRLESWSSR